LWQVGCEFIAACRKLEAAGFSQEDAWAALEDMCNMADTVFMPDTDLWAETHRLQQRYGLSFWDALIVAACYKAGVQNSIPRISEAHETSTGLRSSTLS